jgi:EAL domain-containing protein (putative c-di-GMP-specific phosphodiesterase class I)
VAALIAAAVCVDILKLDKSFVEELVEPRGDVLAGAILQLGRGLGLTTVAEGVETAAQAQRLREMGYDALQGYVFSRPLPPEQVPAFVGNGRRAVPAAPRGGY